MISKLVAAAVSPLGTALVCACLALLLAWAKRQRLAVLVGVAALSWLWLWSTPVASLWLRAQLESSYPPVPVAQLPSAPVAVVLGGAVAAPWGARSVPDLGAAADRVWHAARIHHAGKAPLLLLSGGAHEGGASEAQAMQLFLAALGVPASALLLEGQSRTTQQNAALTADVLKQRGVTRVLLVTSALHMPRALASFEALGLQVVPAAVDHETIGPPPMWPWLPDTGSLDGSGRAFKELLAGWALRYSPR